MSTPQKQIQNHNQSNKQLYRLIEIQHYLFFIFQFFRIKAVEQQSQKEIQYHKITHN